MLIAKQDFYYAGRQLRAGEAFSSESESDREVLLLIGRAELAPKKVPEEVVEENAPEVPRVSNTSMVPESSDRKTRGNRRRYRRTDLEART